MFSIRLFSPLPSHALTHLTDSYDLCFSFFFVIAALQAWPVYSQRAWCYTRRRGVGSLESFWYLFTNMWWGHQDRCAWMQPTRVSSSSLCSHACLVGHVSISAGKSLFHRSSLGSSRVAGRQQTFRAVSQFQKRSLRLLQTEHNMIVFEPENNAYNCRLKMDFWSFHIHFT